MSKAGANGGIRHPQQEEPSEADVKAVSGEFAVSNATILAMPSAGYRGVGAVAMCIHLIHLDLSGNAIVGNLAPLAGLTELSTLLLADNKLISIAGVEKMIALRKLDVRGNCLANHTVTASSLARLPKLESVSFRSLDGSMANPMCDGADYGQTMSTKLPQLLTLDGQRMTGEASRFYAECDTIAGLLSARSTAAAEDGGSEAALAGWLPGTEDVAQLAGVEEKIADAFDAQLADCAAFITAEGGSAGPGAQDAFLTATE